MAKQELSRLTGEPQGASRRGFLWRMLAVPASLLLLGSEAGAQEPGEEDKPGKRGRKKRRKGEGEDGERKGRKKRKGKKGKKGGKDEGGAPKGNSL